MPAHLIDQTGAVSGEHAYVVTQRVSGHLDSTGFYASSPNAYRYVAATRTTDVVGYLRGPVAGDPLQHESVPLAVGPNGLSERFGQLANEWQVATAFSSDVAEIAMHPSYQKIIALGEPVVPLILRELEREPHHWFWALSVLTDVDPVPQSARGDLMAMARAWVEWGRSKGLV